MNTTDPFVITVSRELGSGGRSIGQKLAARLGVRFSDKTLIQSLVKQTGLSVAEIERIKGRKKNWLSDFIDRVAPVPNSGAFLGWSRPMEDIGNGGVTQDDVYRAEREILQGIAAEGSCVIAGRSGFFVLAGHPNKLDIFIRADREKRVARVMEKQQLSREDANAVIDAVDRARDNYVEKYSGKSRYDLRNYDLVLNVDTLDEDGAVDVIMNFIKNN